MPRLSTPMFACAWFALLGGNPVDAQTCAAPIPMQTLSTYSGSSCGANLLPTLNHGASATPGDDVVFRVAARGVTAWFAATLSPGTNGPDVLFLCRSPCGINSECIDAATAINSGSATARSPDPVVDDYYYLVVDSTHGGCGDFSLSLTGPLGRP